MILNLILLVIALLLGKTQYVNGC